MADAFDKHPSNVAAAFQEYNDSLRPFIEKVQADVIEFGLETFAPKSQEAIRARNARLIGWVISAIADVKQTCHYR